MTKERKYELADLLRYNYILRYSYRIILFQNILTTKPKNMGNRSSLLLREEEIAQIQEATGCKFYYRIALFPYSRIHR